MQANYTQAYGHNPVVQKDWSLLLNSVQQLGLPELSARNEEIQRLLKENGVTYNVYGDAANTSRPWQLDPLPLVINAPDWKALEAGLVQRASVLNFILHDLYGERTLLKEGLLPPELIYNHSGFLRQCQGVSLPGSHQLIMYAADVARGADGRMWVINDRTQAPSGKGYALENRSAMAKVLPELFRHTQVRQLSGFFNTYYQTLTEIVSQHKDSPRIVLLTPGEKNETYFEHAFLADYLGINLVQGQDLMVKDSHVWLKTIHGLELVDVIIRRVDDVFTDPLEFRADSMLGVTGLLEVMRKGNVAIANPMGSGILENPGLLPFLPAIAQHFLGTKLILPMVATWWCGQEKEKKYVLENISSLVIKKIDRYTGSHTLVGELLDKQGLARLRDQINAAPYKYVGQEKVNFASIPSYTDHKIEPRFGVFRAFLSATKDSYAVMPGGLTRSSPEEGLFIISNQAGGISKDTWVLQEAGEVPEKEMHWPALPKVQHKNILTSRIAENLYWAGRYSERVLATIRCLKTVLAHIAESRTTPNDLHTQQVLLRSLTDLTMCYPGFANPEKEDNWLHPKEELLHLVQNDQLPGGLMYNIRSLTQAFHSVGGMLSSDTWRMIDDFKETSSNLRKLKPISYLAIQSGLDKVYTALISLLGFITESMPREQGWLMFQTGRKIERTLLICSLVRSTLVVRQNEYIQHQILEAVLNTNQLITTYRYKFRTHLTMENALELLLTDSSNPRSIAYQLEKLSAYLKDIAQSAPTDTIGREQKQVLDASTRIKIAEMADLCHTDKEGYIRKELDTLLGTVSQLVASGSSELTQKYFSHAYSEIKPLIIASAGPVL